MALALLGPAIGAAWRWAMMRPLPTEQACHWISQLVQAAVPSDRKSDRVVIVKVDDAAYPPQSAGPRLPCTNYLPLLTNASGARAVFFDFVFEIADPGAGQFAEAITNVSLAGKVFAATYRKSGGNPQVNESSIGKATIPLRADFYEAHFERCRELPVKLDGSEPSAALRLASLVDPDLQSLAETNEWLWLNLGASSKPFHAFPLSAFASNNSSALLGKIVIVGDFSTLKRETSGGADQRLNALGKPMYGAALHGLAIDNLVERTYWRTVPWWMDMLLAATCGSAVIWLFRDERRVRRKRVAWAALGVVSCGIFLPVLTTWIWSWLIPVGLLTTALLIPKLRPLLPPAPEVFISYKTQNIIEGKHTRAMLLKLVLEAKGVVVWLAPANLYDEGTWKEPALEAIESTDNFILLLDKAVMDALHKNKEPVRIEVDAAWERKLQEEFRFTIALVNRDKVALKGETCPDDWDARKWDVFCTIAAVIFDENEERDLSATADKLISKFRRHPEWQQKRRPVR